MPIFISYSSKDQKSAEAICTAIENRGFPCWISSRDIGPGENFQSQIVRAIRGAKIMVLVFSSNANNSEEIKKELVLAGQSSLVVIPVRVEDVTPDDAFAYEFATRQWIDVFEDWEHAIARVIRQIESVVGDDEPKQPATAENKAEEQKPEEKPTPPSAPAAPAPTAAVPPAAKRQTPAGVILAAAAAVILIVGGLLAWQLWPKGGPQIAGGTTPSTATSTPPSAAKPPQATITIPPASTTPSPPANALEANILARLTTLAPAMPQAEREKAAHNFTTFREHRAFAVSTETGGYWTTANEMTLPAAVDGVLEGCQIALNHPCTLVVSDDTVPADASPQPRDMPRLRYSGDFDPAQIPGLNPPMRESSEVTGYKAAPGAKAAAFNAAGAHNIFIVTGAADQRSAEERALQACADAKLNHPCYLYASGDRVVFPQRLKEPLTVAAGSPAPVPSPAPSAATPAPQPAIASNAPPKTFRDCPNCPEMVVIPAGSFMMGAAPGENERYQVPTTETIRDEPQHRVTIAKPFALAKFDVTRAEFAAFAHPTGFAPRPGCMAVVGNNWVPQPQASWDDPGYPQTDNEPAVCMNMLEINAYLRWLSNTTGKNYRLPSEAEWEYAERAGATTAFYWGDDIKDACAHENVGDEAWGQKYGNSGAIPCNDQFSDIAPVGSFKPNAFGLYDMAGNIFVHVADCWNETYQGAPTDGSAWMTGDCLRHVVRKAAYGNPHPFMFRAASRSPEGDLAKRNRFGFRVALSLE